MAKKICICFDYDKDKNYRFLLKALAENPKFGISFVDLTPDEIASDSIPVIKAGLARKIGDAGYLLVIVGKNANSYHKDRVAIGERNWQWWEIKKAISLKKKLIAVKIESGNSSPDPLIGQGASWAMSYTVASIHKAIESA